MDGLRAYAFVNTFVAHAADGDLSDQELEAIRTNVHRLGRGLGFAASDIDTILLETVAEYWRLLESGQSHVMTRYNAESQVLADWFRRSPDLAVGMYKDLMAVARADGSVSDMETFLINDMKKRWQAVQS